MLKNKNNKQTGIKREFIEKNRPIMECSEYLNNILINLRI